MCAKKANFGNASRREAENTVDRKILLTSEDRETEADNSVCACEEMLKFSSFLASVSFGLKFRVFSLDPDHFTILVLFRLDFGVFFTHTQSYIHTCKVCRPWKPNVARERENETREEKSLLIITASANIRERA